MARSISVFLLTFLTNAAVFTLLFCSFATPVSASGCSKIFGCGVVHNDTPYNMKYTTNPNDAKIDLKHPKPGDGYCKIWNWSGVFSFKQKTVKCTQRTLGPHGVVGGRKSKVDVDAYCFADRNYFAEGSVRIQGVWTKIGDGTTVRCDEGGDMPICEND